MAGIMSVCLLMTFISFLCQSIAVFLPGWTRLKSGTTETQLGVWYKCVNWTSCETNLKDLTNRKEGTPIDTKIVVLLVSETCGFVFLLVSTTMLCFIVCCASSKSSNLTNITVRVVIGLNMSASWSILIGVLHTDLNYFHQLYNYGAILAIIASNLAMLTTFLACCESKSYTSKRPMITGFIDPPSEMYASNSMSKDYYHTNHMPYHNYHHGGPYYG